MILPKYLLPYKINQDKLIRIGPKFDGGYVIHKDALRFTKKIITLGLNDDWSFEKHFLTLNKSCTIDAYDHTVTWKFWIKRFLKDFLHFFLLKKLRFNKIVDIFKYVDYFFFFKKNNHYQIKIGKSKCAVTINEVLSNLNGHQEILLKIDIEGSEYEVLDEIKDNQHLLNTLIVEFHNINQQKNKFFIENFIKENKFLKLIHIHGNNFTLDDYNQPECLELTFINEKIFEKIKQLSDFEYPIKGLDYPNLKRRKDCILKFE